MFQAIVSISLTTVSVCIVVLCRIYNRQFYIVIVVVGVPLWFLLSNFSLTFPFENNKLKNKCPYNDLNQPIFKYF
jgi:hypothetical protein